MITENYLLAPMSAVQRMSIQAGAHALEKIKRKRLLMAEHRRRVRESCHTWWGSS